MFENVYLLTWNSGEFEFDFFFPFMTEQDLPPLFLVASQNKSLPVCMHEA